MLEDLSGPLLHGIPLLLELSASELLKAFLSMGAINDEPLL
jgi:hypothetical protein